MRCDHYNYPPGTWSTGWSDCPLCGGQEHASGMEDCRCKRCDSCGAKLHEEMNPEVNVHGMRACLECAPACVMCGSKVYDGAEELPEPLHDQAQKRGVESATGGLCVDYLCSERCLAEYNAAD